MNDNSKTSNYGVWAGKRQRDSDQVEGRDTAYEKKRLLKDATLPLNKSSSKYIHVGIDPFSGFAPVIRILKSGLDVGIQFTESSFQQLLQLLPVMFADIQAGRSIKYEEELVSYKVFSAENHTLKFVPKAGGFVLYISPSSLRLISEMSPFIWEYLRNLHVDRSIYVTFYKEAALEICMKRLNLDISTLRQIVELKYEGCGLYEFVFKFPNIIFSEIEKELMNNRFLS